MGPDEIYHALWENDQEPFGRPRTARAEEIVALADQVNDRPVLIMSLCELVRAYERSAERGKMFVPFARMLQMWDDRPEDFDEASTYRLHWQFKWVTTGMVSHPQIPLATIQQWLDEMERRYRLAGYGQRAVWSARFDIAEHVGDQSTAQQAFTEWLASERDDMADCPACEANDRGGWLATQGQDDEALRSWAPVLDGELVCEEEPHRLLADSLLPLVRLGRLDQARANHLRGLRMARRNLNLQRAVGDHIEFCALTGNEARGLEILAEHVTWLDAEVTPLQRLGFAAAAALLLRRMCALGHGEEPVTGPPPTGGAAHQQGWTMASLLDYTESRVNELVERFDERNGTAAVSDWARARMARQPLLDRLSLGVRSRMSMPPGPDAQAERPTPADGTATVDDLLQEARRLQRQGDPRADELWRRVADATSGAEVDPVVAAELANSSGQQVAAEDPVEARRHFLDAATRFEALDLPARALLCRTRAALAAMREIGWPAASEELAAARTRVEELAAAGAAEDRDRSAVRTSYVHGLFVAWDAASDDPDLRAQRRAELARELEDLGTQVETHHAGVAEEIRGHLALSDDDTDGASAAFGAAVRLFVAADRPWAAVKPSLVLAQLALACDDLDEGEQRARDALAYHPETLDADIAGHALLLLTEAFVRQERYEEGAAAALDAAHRFDAAGESAHAAHARMTLGRTYHRLGRFAEGAAILEESLPEIAAHMGDFQTALTRQILGFCLNELSEHRAAAQHFLMAAETAQAWEDQVPHAQLATHAAHALSTAAMTAEAVEAFESAIRVWRGLGETGPMVRTQRALAWHVQGQLGDLDRALGLMDQARQELAALDGAAVTDDLDVSYEWSETDDQTARLLAGAASQEDPDGSRATRAHDHAIRAVEGFAALGEPRFGDLVAAHTLAAQIESDLLGEHAPAAARLRDIIAVCESRGDAPGGNYAAHCRDLLERILERAQQEE